MHLHFDVLYTAVAEAMMVTKAKQRMLLCAEVAYAEAARKATSALRGIQKEKVYTGSVTAQEQKKQNAKDRVGLKMDNLKELQTTVNFAGVEMEAAQLAQLRRQKLVDELVPSPTDPIPPNPTPPRTSPQATSTGFNPYASRAHHVSQTSPGSFEFVSSREQAPTTPGFHTQV